MSRESIPATTNAEPTIAVILTRDQAHAASCAMARSVRQDAENLSEYLDHRDVGEGSLDAQAVGKRLRRSLDALDRLGWPHHHEWDGCEELLTEADEVTGPWGRTMRARQRDEYLREREERS